MIVVAIVLAVVLVVVVGAAIVRSRRTDTVDSFRRGLDALSQEARRPVVDQVQHHVRPEPIDADRDDADEPDAATGTDAATDVDAEVDADEGGPSGT